ncbi:regulation of nuclear pre-mRNA domain-containing protein 1A-like isoform X1 [Salvia splendens]|uniref:regulation of nuclear pre-mRNA domain-containing protein 1A-like isoform X1 n=1 Tax=Salvia splendens TaxID=180675 RepID=UPI001C270791|nr:regulation of nuclear pre-mRNA domain-containing protein 1A-like isoform X1 [Salvia splendens]XP_042063109.1 regulation of nuclear pre-mRNA domain-containing protein 1A-like isoform X1 [Salvia splendens]XP_042063110.1 regulation of nuclear pre-mRNA domain-containing protein 1A-like isoform X1 [Salvia splendens]XP_042063111.1 regulation of nuclear pre-mRNA domain-containing protein 1A-like isoform X1 [Salvia splendens]
MGDENFNETILTEKLSKLNSSQQSIESLSRWCISHRKKAKQVVETWEKLFKAAPNEQRVSFLYLSNDILQNSRRKGSEFVNEFWKVLPRALKIVYESSNENCRKVAFRLVDIWEERKVFGSRGQNLKNELLGKNPSPVSNGKIVVPNPIKVVKRDATSLRIKLAVGSLPEKILTALQLVHDEAVNEEEALGKFQKAISSVQEIEKDVQYASSQGNLYGSDVVDNIETQENAIKQCINELEKSEAVRVDLVSQLREALQDQETKLEQVRSEISAARSQIEQAANIRFQLTSNSSVPLPVNQVVIEPPFPSAIPATNITVPPTNPLTSFANPTTEESKKAAAAAVAAKLTASTSSAQMFTSILSSLVAEEAASMSSGLKRQKLEPPMSFSDGKNPEGTNSTCFMTSQQAMTSMPPVQSSTVQTVSQVNQLQAQQFHPPPLPPLPPLAPPGNSPSNQMVQSNMMGLTYGYGANNLLPPPLSNAPTGFARPNPPPQQTQQQPQSQQLQQPASGGYYRPVGIGFYGQSHQPPMPPIHRQ